MAILSKACKPDHFESHNSLKLGFTNIRGLHSNFVECESFLESNSPDNLALCKTNLDDSINSDNFSVRGYLPIIQKGFQHSYAWSCSLCERRTFFCRRLISRKLCRFLLMMDWLYFTQCLTSFSSIDCLLCRCARFLFLFRLIQMRFSRSTHLLIFCLWRL